MKKYFLQLKEASKLSELFLIIQNIEDDRIVSLKEFNLLYKYYLEKCRLIQTEKTLIELEDKIKSLS